MFQKKQIRKYITPQRVLISGIIVMSSIYLVVQSVKAMSMGVVSTPADYVTIDDSIPAEGWFVRSETVTEGTSSSTVKHIVSNGEKVQAQSALAVVYADETIMDASRRLEEINAELELLNTALQSAGNYTNDNTKTEQQMIVQMQNLSALVDDGMPTGAADTATQIRKLSLRRNASD
ncbi:MAG: HlyD family efflux transporter periplasmic adaptor subunit, partial [Butyricicoccus pullicaecorum]|nr:HlyD family efflux transporter periplasmic adaptor subunit [Butyricicoccus pullicaecorum]